jgi:hypothetical protein
MSRYENSGPWGALVPSLFTQASVMLAGMLLVPFGMVGWLYIESVLQAHRLAARGCWPFSALYSGELTSVPWTMNMYWAPLAALLIPPMTWLGTLMLSHVGWLIGAGILLGQFPLRITPWPNFDEWILPILVGCVQAVIVLRYFPRSRVLPRWLGHAVGLLVAAYYWGLPLLLIVGTWSYTLVLWAFAPGR